jgi:2-methylfumaryl-CoA hydratase
MSVSKTDTGRFFEDFRLGETIRHATPRTLTQGDAALYAALYGMRFAVQSSDVFARTLGYRQSPLDDLLVFHTVFGKSVPDISINAVANLGYADGRFLAPVYPGDTLSAVSDVIGLKENANGKTGIVYVRTQGFNQHGDGVLIYVRWVMVNKRNNAIRLEKESVPDLPDRVPPALLGTHVPTFDPKTYDTVLAGSAHRFADYTPGERINHIDGMTVEEAEHQIATRLYQNTAKVHFDAQMQKSSRFGRRLIYGGHVISLARALSFNGLGNAFAIGAINAGRHAAPLFAGDTVKAFSTVLETATIPGRTDIGAVRIRLFATKNREAAAFPEPLADGSLDADTILDLDLWLLVLR